MSFPAVTVAQKVAKFVKENDLDGVDCNLEHQNVYLNKNGSGTQWVIGESRKTMVTDGHRSKTTADVRDADFHTELRKQLPSPYIISHAPQAPWFSPGFGTSGVGCYVDIHKAVGASIDFYNVRDSPPFSCSYDSQ